MKKNIGNADRVARVCIGALLAFLAFTPSVDGGLAIAFYALAAYLVLTAIIDFCLIYRLLDIDTHDHGGTYHSGEDVYDGRGGA